MRIINTWQSIPFENILSLYEAVGWTSYTKTPERLKKAFEHSTFVLIVLKEDEVIGVIRSVSDFVSIHYLQDILIHPNHQRAGIGRLLLSKALEYFKDVRTHILLTDNEERQAHFYRSFGYKNTRELQKHQLNAFVQMKGIELE